jgi:plastocyanin
MIKAIQWVGFGIFLFAQTLSSSAASFTVTASGVQFVPSSISINVGDTVTWTGLFSHTVTGNSANEPFCGNASPPGGSCSVTFNAPGSFSYRCVPHAGFGMTGLVTVAPAAAPPSVVITNPPDNLLLAAPATFVVGVQATDSDGSVASVQLLTNGVAGILDAIPPFALNLNDLPAGNYVLRARATDNQALSATSAPVNLRVVNRPSISVAPGSNAAVALRVGTVAGVTYVFERSGTFTNFSSIQTNLGNGALLEFNAASNVPGENFYRVRLE